MFAHPQVNKISPCCIAGACTEGRNDARIICFCIHVFERIQFYKYTRIRTEMLVFRVEAIIEPALYQQHIIPFNAQAAAG